MQHLSLGSPKGTPPSRGEPEDVTARQGSARCVELNHMLHRLCGPPSIPLSFSLAAVLPRRGAYCVSCVTAGVKTRHNYTPSFTAWTTRVSNPVCSPRFRVSASVSVQVAAFATGVPPDIYEFHLYTGNSATLSGTQARQFRAHFLG